MKNSHPGRESFQDQLPLIIMTIVVITTIVMGINILINQATEANRRLNDNMYVTINQ